MRAALRDIADYHGLWAGLPMPMDGRRLVIEPRFPHADVLAEIGIKAEQRAQEEAQAEHDRLEFGNLVERNRFWSFHRKAEVVVYQDKDGKVRHFLAHGRNRVDWLVDTMDVSWAWGIEQESRAVQALGRLVRHHIFKSYLLTGMFLERSERTGLVYIFRRLRPTIVLDTRQPGGVRIRCALCMHPVGYYEGTWAGAMTPTDEVIAHLMMMRGDEAMFWRRANQHPPYRQEAGIL